MGLRPLLASLALVFLVAAVEASVSATYTRPSVGPMSTPYYAHPAAPLALGAEVALDGSLGEADLNENGAGAPNPAGAFLWAEGTCKVSRLGLGGGAFDFACGVDRDDDGLVTNVDLGGAMDPDGFDDDLAGGSVSAIAASGTLAVCFRADAVGTTGSAAGAHWDEAFAYVGNAQGVHTYGIELALTTSDNGCSMDSSGHTHDWWG